MDTAAAASQTWQASGSLVDIPINVQLTVNNQTNTSRLPLTISAKVQFAWGQMQCGHAQYSLLWSYTNKHNELQR